MAIHQDGGMQEEHSRYDDELARLHDKLGRTAIGYGAAAPAVAAATRHGGGGARAAVKAARAGFMAKNGSAVGGKGDLVEAIAKRRGQAGRRPGRAARGHEGDGQGGAGRR